MALDTLVASSDHPLTRKGIQLHLQRIQLLPTRYHLTSFATRTSIKFFSRKQHKRPIESSLKGIDLYGLFYFLRFQLFHFFVDLLCNFDGFKKGCRSELVELEVVS